MKSPKRNSPSRSNLSY